MQPKRPGEETKEGLRKFEQKNNIVEEEFYSYDEKEYDDLMKRHPWKSKYALLRGTIVRTTSSM